LPTFDQDGRVFRRFINPSGERSVEALRATQAQISDRGLRERIKNGTVNGAYLPTFDQDAFLGVPFAQPPVGDLRLRRPQSLNTSFAGGVYEATEYSPFVLASRLR
jgi:hypothetical protein